MYNITSQPYTESIHLGIQVFPSSLLEQIRHNS